MVDHDRKVQNKDFSDSNKSKARKNFSLIKISSGSDILSAVNINKDTKSTQSIFHIIFFKISKNDCDNKYHGKWKLNFLFQIENSKNKASNIKEEILEKKFILQRYFL